MRAHKRRPSSIQYPSLPSELWTEIFARLPAKTLMNFRCVCKSWCSIIDSPDFISMHIKFYPHNCQKTHLLVLESLLSCGASALVYKIRRLDTLRKTTQLVVNNSQFDMVYGSDMINGLMLMENDGFFVRDLCLWNPSLKKSLMLPPCPLTFMNNSQVGFFLGYAPSSFDHKVIAFRSVDSSTGELSMAVYSLSDRLWRVRPNNIYVSSWCFGKLMSGCGIVYSQGAVYWRPGGIEEESCLVCFEFDAEEFIFVELPNTNEKMLRFLFLRGESLAVFGVSRERSCIWVMEKVLKEIQWRQCFLGDSTSEVYEFFACFVNLSTKFLYVEKSGTFLVLNDGKLMSYNINSHDIKSHRIEHLGKPVHCLYVDICVDSLVLGVAQRSQDPTSTSLD